MKKIFTSILIIYIITFFSVGGHAEDQLKEIFDQISPAVVTVISYDYKRQVLQQGTGFFINPEGHLITNYHVLKEAYSVDIEIQKGRNYAVEQVLAENKSADIVKLKVDIPKNLFKWIRITPKAPSTAERIVVIGSPMGFEHTISEGIVSAIRNLPDFGDVYQISAPVSPGSSGSPVLNMDGEAIGIATFQSFKGQNLNFAVPAEYIINLKGLKNPTIVSKWNYGTEKKDSTKKSKSIAALMDSAKQPEKTVIQYIIHFKNGKKLEVDEYWEEGSWIKCNRYGTDIGYAMSQIERIEKKEIIEKADETFIADYHKPERDRIYETKRDHSCYSIWFDSSLWNEQGQWQIKKIAGAEMGFRHEKADIMAFTIPGRKLSSPSYAALVEEVLTAISKSNSPLKILYQDRRIVNSKDIFFIRTQETINGEQFTECNYYWAGLSGTLGFVVITKSYNFDKYEKDIMDILNGLVINDR